MTFIAAITAAFWWSVRHWRLFAIAAVLVAVAIGVAYTKACWTAHKAKMSEKQVQQAKIAIETHNDEQLKQILAEVDTREANLDAPIKQAEENTRQAKKNYDGWSSEQLAEEAERRVKEAQSP